MAGTIFKGEKLILLRGLFFSFSLKNAIFK